MLTNNQQLGNAYFELDAFIQAAEGEQWPDSITSNPKTFARLQKLEGTMQRALAAYFKDFAANRVMHLVDWREYRNRQYQQAAELVVEVNAAAFAAEQKILLNVLFDFIVEGSGIGADASSVLYNVPFDTFSLQAAVERQARQYSTSLVKGISKTTREGLRSSLETSLSLGEDIDTATQRIAKRVGNPARATTIARTEAVNSYGEGTLTFGKQTGAKGKVADVVQDDRTSPICQEIARSYGNSNKPLDINKPYTWFAAGGGSAHAPGFHVNCRTSQYLIY